MRRTRSAARVLQCQFASRVSQGKNDKDPQKVSWRAKPAANRCCPAGRLSRSPNKTCNPDCWPSSVEIDKAHSPEPAHCLECNHAYGTIGRLLHFAPPLLVEIQAS